MVTNEQYAALSEFRYRLNQFLRFSEAAAREVGLSTAQYQLLLHARAADKHAVATIGVIARRMGTTHQAAVALVKRCEARGLVEKRRSVGDERKVEVHLTSSARRLISKLATQHLKAISTLDEVIRTARLAAARQPAARLQPRVRGRVRREAE